MNDTIANHIEAFLNTASTDSLENLKKSLNKEIVEAVKGQRQSRLRLRLRDGKEQVRVFHFYQAKLWQEDCKDACEPDNGDNDNPTESDTQDDDEHRGIKSKKRSFYCHGYRLSPLPENLLPGIVECEGILIDFSEVEEILLKRLLKKIKQRHERTLEALTGEPLDRKKWIRKTLSYVLKSLFDRENKMTTSADTVPENEEGEGIPIVETIPYEELDEGAIDLKLDKSLRREAFFWKPGELFQGKPVQATRAVYIAFFYSWLRRQGLWEGHNPPTFAELGKETGVDGATVSRWTPKEPALRQPFFEKKIPSHPVFFSEDSRRSIGMYDSAIRCYEKEDYDDHGAYAPIKKRKTILWDIYILLNNPEELDRLKTNYDKLFDKGSFKCELKSNDEIGIHPKKRYSLVYIASVSI